jgi:hypothetical protein
LFYFPGYSADQLIHQFQYYDGNHGYKVLKKAPPRLAGHTLNHTKPKILYTGTSVIVYCRHKSNESECGDKFKIVQWAKIDDEMSERATTL